MVIILAETMKVFLLLLLVYLNYISCDDNTQQNLKVLPKLYPKKVKPQGSIHILQSRKQIKYNLPAFKVKTKQPDGEYTAFPLINSDHKKVQNIPDSPYFPLEPNVEKPRVKKVLSDYHWSPLRNKRSADIKTKVEDDAKIVRKEYASNRTNDKTRKASKKRKDTLLKEYDKKSLKANRNKTSKYSKLRHRKHKTKESKYLREKVSKRKRKELKYTIKPAKRIARHRRPQKSLLPRSKHGSTAHKLKHDNKSKVVSRRLIAARDALVDDYPYVVSIQKSGQHWCAGALLNPRMVITTANCLWKSSQLSRLRIRAGSRYFDRGGQTAQIQEVMKHPGWRIRRSPDNDVAVILLDRNIKFSDSVHGVDLPNRVMMPAFDDAWVTSWGANRRDGIYDLQGSSLQVYHTRLVDRAKCNNVTQRYGVTVTENFICLAQTGRRAPCTRDTGAPAVSDGVLWGLASWGIRKLCGTERFPAVFSYIASQSNMDFIMNATHHLMADERLYPFPDRLPIIRASTTSTTTMTLPF